MWPMCSHKDIIFTIKTQCTVCVCSDTITVAFQGLLKVVRIKESIDSCGILNLK